MILHLVPYHMVFLGVCPVLRHFPFILLETAFLGFLLPLFENFRISGESLRHYIRKLRAVFVIEHHLLGFRLKEFEEVLHRLKQIVGEHSRTVCLLITAKHLSAPVDEHTVNLACRSCELCLFACLNRDIRIVLEEYVGRNLYVYVLHVEPNSQPFGSLAVLCYYRFRVCLLTVLSLIVVFEEKWYRQCSC